ncbi:MAG: BatD family protein [Phycisphaerae bacterium]
MPRVRFLSILGLMGWWVFGAAGTAAAQTPRLELVIGKKSMQVGESISMQLIGHNMARPDNPSAAVPDGLSLELVNAVPSSSVRIVNGVRSSKYTYSLLLTAEKIGKYELGPITVKAGTQTYSAEPITITVARTDVSGKRGDRIIFGELEVQPRSVYVTQSVVAKLTIGIREVVIDRRRYDMNLLRDVFDSRKSSLSVFENGQADRSTMTIADSKGQRHRYQIFTVTERVRAEEVGQLAIGPIRLSAEYPTAVRRSFFGYDVTRSRPEFTLLPQINVEVKEPPTENRPPSFTGALGRYQIGASALPVRVEQGKPVTLTLAINGAPLDGVAGPDLGDNAELVSRFDFVREEWIGDVQGGSKVFRRAIFPRQAGVQNIPPIEWTYFDPSREEYITLATPPIEVTVDPPSGDASPMAVNEGGDTTGENGTSLVLLEGGIAPNYVDVPALLAVQGATWTTGHWTALIAPPVAWSFVGLLAWRYRRLRGNEGLARRRSATRKAERILRDLPKAGSTTAQLDVVSQALKSYLADRYNMPPGEITPVDARRVITDGGGGDIAAEVAALLETASASAYAPIDEEGFRAEEVATKLRGWMKILDRAK